MPLAPRSPRPRMRPPLVTQMNRTSFTGQLRSTSLTCPLRVIDRYIPRGRRKMWSNFRQASPTVGSYTIRGSAPGQTLAPCKRGSHFGPLDRLDKCSVPDRSVFPSNDRALAQAGDRYLPQNRAAVRPDQAVSRSLSVNAVPLFKLGLSNTSLPRSGVLIVG